MQIGACIIIISLHMQYLTVMYRYCMYTPYVYILYIIVAGCTPYDSTKYIQCKTEEVMNAEHEVKGNNETLL